MTLPFPMLNESFPRPQLSVRVEQNTVVLLQPIHAWSRFPIVSAVWANSDNFVSLWYQSQRCAEINTVSLSSVHSKEFHSACHSDLKMEHSEAWWRLRSIGGLVNIILCSWAETHRFVSVSFTNWNSSSWSILHNAPSVHSKEMLCPSTSHWPVVQVGSRSTYHNCIIIINLLLTMHVHNFCKSIVCMRHKAYWSICTSLR